MSKIRKGHPRYGAAVGTVVNGWRCTCAGWILRGDLPVFSYGNEADARAHADLLRAPDLRYGVRRQTVWRRVRPVLRQPRPGLSIFVGATSGVGDPVEASFGHPSYMRILVGGVQRVIADWPPHVTTPEQRRRFCERLARLYGYEVESASDRLRLAAEGE